MNDAAPVNAYQRLVDAKRSGKTKCLANAWPGYEIYRLDKIYLVTQDNKEAFEEWLTRHQIPIRDGDRSRHYVYP